MGIKGSDNFANNIKKAKKKREDIFIIRPHQITIFHVKLNIKMQHLNLFQDNFIIPKIKYNK